MGVQRAIAMLEKAAREGGDLEALGNVVHNERVMQKLREMGVKVIQSPEDVKSKVVAISSHGVSPSIEAELRARKLIVVDTTCPFVRRAQIAARRLAEAGFWVVVYGEADHEEVKGILGWAQGKGIATLEVTPFIESKDVPCRLGILSQTTQIPENFIKFAKEMIEITFKKDSEIRIIDTICHDIRKRQICSLDLARKVDLMLVVGGRSSANTRRLKELCSAVTETYQIDSTTGINRNWLEGKKHIGVTSGTSTSEESIEEIVKYLKEE